ncbi:3',5'-cyclic AMP phosphodiesterase CpdA [Paraburkholderia graminis]|uniref:metallophosphoesterase family protein n=1 Tax=Paraburkholderia graminis TaxID=60548 RepID=UPI0028674F05|nr:metallophosphoesterase [Paraburkholderia graminis]MDR6469420.1 3',5'-cyclic AMP phosphodiesterase CpdA [Paraburkholderia graminis]
MLRVAVLSDLHYTQVNKDLCLPQAASAGGLDSMEELIKRFRPDNPSADLLVCPGDITDRANPVAFATGWKQLNRLGTALGVKRSVAATGNHEVQSRLKGDPVAPGNAEHAIDPVEFLVNTPGYPTAFALPHQKWVYWGRGYEILRDDESIIVIVNSCHYHVTLQDNEFERGRISDAALRELQENLKEWAADRPFRLLVVHHPPLPHEETGLELGRTPMHNGPALMKVLRDTGLDWLVIHGHKHHHRLVRADGEVFQPFVFGAASFGAMLRGDMARRTRNQFYIITLETTKDALDADQLSGSIQALHWSNSGWEETTDISWGLPNGCGFTSQTVDLSALAVGMRNLLQKPEGQFLEWAEMVVQLPQLRFLMPEQVMALKDMMRRAKINFLDGDSLFPSQLSMSAS